MKLERKEFNMEEVIIRGGKEDKPIIVIKK